MSDLDKIKQLRKSTGAGFKDCNVAIKDSGGDLKKAAEILRVKGISKASKKMSRDAKEGVVALSGDQNKSSVIEVNCETDFVAKTDGFLELANNVAMQIAASNPMAIDESSLSEELIAKEKEIYTDQAKSSGKPDNVVEKIVEGKLKKFKEDNCLVHQSFVKNPDVTIGQLIQEGVSKLGENITINRFVRFALGEQSNN